MFLEKKSVGEIDLYKLLRFKQGEYCSCPLSHPFALPFVSMCVVQIIFSRPDNTLSLRPAYPTLLTRRLL